jgi:hypothetical protein
MRVNISYTCPVQVIVDLDTGEIDRVIVIDEGITAEPDGFAEDADEYKPVGGHQKARAFAIAEAAEWPSWDLGW